ncbi:MAG: UTP--glucose-1-phosphate uridylyltransferase [Candidatus Hydrogenedentota bacterium]
MNRFIETITSSDPALRDRSFAALAADMAAPALIEACEELEQFRRRAENLYERVRATLFLYAAYRFHLMESPDIATLGSIPYDGFSDFLERRYERAIDRMRQALAGDGANGAILSALAETYHHLAFQTLADQVRKSVQASEGNRWMFRVGHAEDHPVRVRPELLRADGGRGLYPVLTEATPVRLDLSHSGWSDIFFLGMDYPEGARVLNISVDLGVYGRDSEVRPPVETYVRVITEPLLRLTSIDLETTKDVTDLKDLFNFGNDYLSLLKAGVIASGLVPPSFEGTGQSVSAILGRVVAPGMGIEMVTKVNDIPKGSRLAVSTNLLASIVAVLMRTTGQTESVEGGLTEPERRLVASRAILGEWLGGSGGGWQDSGGVWPGLKVIQGAAAQEGDPEWGVSKGRLLPEHHILTGDALHPETPQRLAESLVVLHGGMAQNVGPILEMVTEKYLLRNEREWHARHEMRGIFDGILEALRQGDMQTLGQHTAANFAGPLRAVIPWATNHFTETVIHRVKEKLGGDYWGFLMLGGMSGGGMAMFIAPERRAKFRGELLAILGETKRELEDALPFAMDPVVYDFAINQQGTRAKLLSGGDALLPGRYYGLQIPGLVHRREEDIPYLRRAELDYVAAQAKKGDEASALLRTMVRHLFRVGDGGGEGTRTRHDEEAAHIKEAHGFDPIHHEQIRRDLRAGRIGLAHNRLPVETEIEDVAAGDVLPLDEAVAHRQRGEAALRDGKAAVLSLAAGVGTRWTSGAGVIKAVNPFIEMEGRHRSFLELHLAKTRQVARVHGNALPHIVSTSYLTHGPIEKHLALNDNYGHDGPLYLSPGRAIGQRLVPTVRDLVFLWEEMPQEALDPQKQKVRDAVRATLMEWARQKGEAADYTDNLPLQRFHPPGHWYEVPNLFRNGVLARLLAEHPQVETIMLHNIDTLGANLDAAALGAHLDSGDTLTFEVVPRRVADRGGGLARVNGQMRLLEGLAQPREEDELRLRYYNSMTTWIQVGPLLELFGLTRDDLANGSQEKISAAVRRMGQRVPTYVTIKDVKYRWGHGQEDVFPVAQFEKLWSDMSALADVPCGFLAVDRMRGQQLKSPDELDAWANDGSKDYVAGISDLA